MSFPRAGLRQLSPRRLGVEHSWSEGVGISQGRCWVLPRKVLVISRPSQCLSCCLEIFIQVVISPLSEKFSSLWPGLPPAPFAYAIVRLARYSRTMARHFNNHHPSRYDFACGWAARCITYVWVAGGKESPMILCWMAKMEARGRWDSYPLLFSIKAMHDRYAFSLVWLCLLHEQPTLETLLCCTYLIYFFILTTYYRSDVTVLHAIADTR